MKETATFLEIVFDLFLWSCIFISIKSIRRQPHYVKSGYFKLACLLCMAFCLFPFFGGDYFHYNDSYEQAKIGGYAHMEYIYVCFIQNWCYSYHMFRLGVWGLALFITVQAFKRFEVNSQLAFFFFAVIYLPWFSYARASLAMAFIVLGLSFIAKPIARWHSFSFILGICLMIISLAFHRTAPIGIVCALGSLFFKNPSRKTIVLLCILFPCAVFVLSYALNMFMNIELGYDDYITGRQRDDYLTGDAEGGLSMGIGPYIMVFFARAPLFVVAVTYIYCAFKGIFKTFPKSIKVISSYAFLLILLAIAFSFDLGFNTYTLYYRTLIFAHIPSAIFLAQLCSSNCTPRLFKCIYYPSVFGILYTFIYTAYCALVV